MQFTKSFARGGVWFLFAFLMGFNAFAEAEIIDLANYRMRKMDKLRRSCSTLLTSKPFEHTGPAKILPFKQPIPPFVSWETFKEELRNPAADTNFHYFYHGSYSSKAPFSIYDSGTWMTQSYVPSGDFLYIVKAKPKWTGRPEATGQVSYNIRSLRRGYDIIEYSRIQVPPLIKVLELAINHTRMMESNLSNQPYHAQRLSYDALLRADSLHQAALQFIDLWTANNPHEEDIKWFIKDMIIREDRRSNPADKAQRIKKAIQEKLEALYRNSPY